jgi:tetratricopeptide (TPR) repeat protein
MVAPDSAAAPAYTYDAFISYSHADRAWVDDWLLPRLERAGLRICIDHRDFDVGAAALDNMERAAAASRHTLLVLTPAWVQSEWAGFEALLVQGRDPASLHRRTLPVLRDICTVPGRIANLTYADLRGAPDDAEFARLLDAIRDRRRLPDNRALVTLGQPPALPGAAATSAAAEQRLAALPLDSLPEPAALPPGSRMPFLHNPLFVGRAAELRRIADALKVGDTAAISQSAAATGMGGIGKTQLAVEFVHRYGHYFTGVFWLSFADPNGVPAEVAACGLGGALGLPAGFKDQPLDAQMRMVLLAWQSPLPRLLVFDNCEDEALLVQWLPRSGGCRVLVTSRRAQWDAALGIAALSLDVLPRDQSIALLRRFRPELPADDPDLSAIAAELGDLPLALHLAGSYLRRYQAAPFGTPAAYLAQLRQGLILQHPSLAATGAAYSPTEHDLHVARTFVLSYARLDHSYPVDKLALELLQRAAYLAWGAPIPHDLLLATLDLPADDADDMQAEEAIIRLVSLGLLDVGASGVARLHRLLARFVRDIASDEAARDAVEQALIDNTDALIDQGYPARLLPILPHLRDLTDTARDRADEHAATLCTNLSRYLGMVGDYAAAQPYAELALAICEQTLGPQHPATATSLNNLALLLWAQGDYAAARPLYERDLAICEQTLGPQHPATATSLNNLALLLRAQGDYTAARPLHERDLAICEQTLGPQHPHTATSLNNLAGLLSDQGDYAAARPLHERALAIREQTLGPQHPHTATSLNNLALLLVAQGDYAAARPLYERDLAICEQTLGPQHPATATSLNNLAELLRAQGDYAAARPLYERDLAICEQTLGPQHPATATSLNNLALLCASEGSFPEAAALMRRALAIREQALGPQHPHTQTARRSLAAIEQRMQQRQPRSWWQRLLGR